MHLFVMRRRRWSLARHGLLLLGVTLLAERPAVGLADEPSAGLLLRRARYAIVAGRTAEAAVTLRSVRDKEPRSRRGLEAALLLADLEFSRDAGAPADAVLAAAERDFPDGDGGAQVLLARGWLALARGDATAARRHFGLVPARGAQRFANELALLGSAWAGLIAQQHSNEVPPELVTLAASASDPALRTAAALTLARAHAARHEIKKALHGLRAVRRVVRGTSFADDVELAIGLAQLDMGAPAAARRTFSRLAERQDRFPSTASAPSLPRVTLADLRLPPQAFAARLAQLYAGRRDLSVGPLPFFAGALDRPARSDAPAALSLAAAAIAARKEH